VTFAGRVETAYITIAGELAAQENPHLSKGRFRWLRRGE
jgi:hypothetical protein